jgi:hypothetical protein
MKKFILILVLLAVELATDSLYAQGILALQTKSISIYPNPNNGKFNISLKNSISKMHVEIYTIWGQKIYESSTRSPLPENEIDFSLRPKGVYFIKINDGENSYTHKIIIL